MIITRITLQNYKQYRGEQTFELAEDATIGVIGANGVGKTTIFEAIEWCLYKPTGISNGDIRPRGTGGEVKVTLQLTTNDGEHTYEVERVLKRSSTQATVYELNEIGGATPIVQGTREVTDYISTRLIGLGHAAFVATFFTRQKELSFFGTMRPADRRREVGKLLGLETIKQAQQLIAEERKAVNADADSLQRQYDAKTSGRDLDAEIEAAKATIASQQQLVEQATAARAEADRVVEDADRRVQALQAQRDRYTTIKNELELLQGQQQSATERQQSIGTQLGHLDERARERDQHVGPASDEPALRKEQERLEAERQRFEHRRHLLAELDGCHRALDQARKDIRATVERADRATDHPDWRWTDTDDAAPLPGIDRLTAVISTVDLPAAERTLADLRAAATDADTFDKEHERLTRYEGRKQELLTRVERLERIGDPATQRAQLDATATKARRARSDAQARIDTLTKQIRTSRQLADRLQHQHFEDTCPTCGRAFDDAEAEVVISTLQEAIRRHEDDIAAAREQISSADEELARVQQELTAVQEREGEIRDCRSRLESAEEYLDTQRDTVRGLKQRLDATLARLGRERPPAPADIAVAERAVEHARVLKASSGQLQMLRNTIATTRDAEARHRQELEQLTDIDWDEATWRDVSQRHDAAVRAASSIEQIDRELARRPQLEEERREIGDRLAQVAERLATQQAALAEVGFEPEHLDEATRVLHANRRRRDEAVEALHTAEKTAQEARFQLQRLHHEQQQVAELLTHANAKRAEKAELDMMYSEFSEFDKFVAQKQSPLLSEITSDIVAEMTDGKYTRVEFDEDYGIQVFDHTDERFPLETFSGGERDAISLAARLALSRLIGSQAANPPGFLVLDEVFGSLDADRRERVLTLLGQHSSEHFRQMFIVSHIDDVQQSPVFDTIWQVTETDDGSSTVDVGASLQEHALAG